MTTALRARHAAPNHSGAGEGWEEMSLAESGHHRHKPAPPQTSLGTPAVAIGGVRSASGCAIQYRVACEAVSVGEWRGEAELAVLDGACLQLLFPAEPPLTLSLHSITAAQLSLVGADADAGAAPPNGPAPARPARGGRHGAAVGQPAAKQSEFMRATAAVTPPPTPPPEEEEEEDWGSTGGGGRPGPMLGLGLVLQLELEHPLEAGERAPRHGRLLRAEATLGEAERLGQLVEAVHAGESKRLGVESPWTQFASERQLFGQPPRLTK
jgi:hypothetical protein